MSHDTEQQQLARRLANPAESSARFQNVIVSGNSQAILGDTYHIHEAAQRTPEQASLDAHLEALKYPGMLDRFHSLNDPYPETFQWIMRSHKDDEQPSEASSIERQEPLWDSFTDWLEDGSDPYWIMGKLGTGKSILMKYIVERLSDNQDVNNGHRDRIVVSHFFWEPGAELQGSITGCLRSLLWQLLPFQPEITCPRNHNGQNVHSVQRLCREVVSCVGHIKSTVFIFLDGLDECRETNDVLDLADALRALKHVKLCVSSRPEEAYLLNFSDCPKLRLQDLNKNDIEHVVRTELLENSRVRRSKSWTREHAENLAWSILCKAEGVFLWVRLVIKELLRGFTGRDTLEQMYMRLETLPTDVYTLYTALIRRNNQKGQDYASQAALYCRVIMTYQYLEAPLLAFYFATHDGIRARFLDTDNIFEQNIADFESEIDYELLATWINVRTGGLLTVTQEKTSNLRPVKRHHHDPEPFLSRFDDHRVCFVHRSAYTYLQNTIEGRLFAEHCSRSQAELTLLCFESLVVYNFVLPGMIRCLISPRDVPELNLRSLSIDRKDIVPRCLEVLQEVCDKLYARGCIQVAEYCTTLYTPLLFPTTKYRDVDLCAVMAMQGHTELVEVLTQRYECQHDHTHMALLHLSLIYHKLHAASYWDETAIAGLLRSLSTHAIALNTVTSTNFKEEVHLMKDLASAMYVYRSHTMPTSYGLVWQFILKYKTGPDFYLMPLSRDLESTMRASRLHRCLSVYFSLSLDTMQNWAMENDHGAHQYCGCAFALTEGGPGADEQRIKMICPSDSEEVLQILERAQKQLSDLDIRNLRGVGWANFGNGSEFWEMMQPVFQRSQYVDSFVDCLRHIGKSEETIECFLRSVVVETHYAPAPRINRWGSYYFDWLLGRRNVASWCQRIPELQVLLDSERQRADDMAVDVGDAVEISDSDR